MAPPPVAPHPPPAANSLKPRHSWMLRCIVLAILATILLAVLIFVITWVTVQPRKLKYSVEHGAISGFNLTSSNSLDANFHFVLRANNPNKRVSLYYDRIDVRVLYDDQELAKSTVYPFYQPRRNVTHLDLDLTANDVAVYGAVARDLKADRGSGEMDLDIRIRAKIRLKVGVFKIHRKLKLYCEGLRVPFSSSKGFERVSCDADVDG